jgi:adenine-specific DNA-methyltransferase
LTEQLSAWSTGPKAFRPVQYLGSKLRLLDALTAAVDDVDLRGGRLLDLFSGSGVVAAHFALTRSVIAADIQKYASVLAAALLADVELTALEILALVEEQIGDQASANAESVAALDAFELSCIERALRGDYKPLCAVVEDGSLARYTEGGEVTDAALAAVLAQAVRDVSVSVDTVLTRYYGGVYFGYRQAAALDALAAAARSLLSPMREVALAAVLSTASDIVTSVGSHFAQPIRVRGKDGAPKPPGLRAVARQRGLDVRKRFVEWLDRYCHREKVPYSGISLCADFREVLAQPPLPVSVVYADPPYTRDHYSRYYHVLETIARGDEPGLATMRLGDQTLISRGLYRSERHQSPFCIKSQAYAAFEDLIAGTRRLGVPLVLSYSPHGGDGASRPRVLGLDDIAALAREHYPDVRTVKVEGIAHSKLNASELNADIAHDAERLVVCRS